MIHSAEPIPKVLGDYVLGDQIAVGGMGIVRRAQHRSTGQTVAIKTVRLRSPELLAAFRREVYALALLRHPAIVRILDHGTSGDLPWYAMEFVDGQSLSQRLTGSRSMISGIFSTAGEGRTIDASPRSPRSTPPPPSLSIQESLEIVQQICRAVSFLHGCGLVHRDLKPENVLIKPNGTVVLVDFGLVVQFGGARGRDVLELTDAAGTFAYMSPEQRLGRFVDARADLFSIGCILYECLAGILPFGITGLHDWRTQAPSPISSINPTIAPELDALVSRLLAKEPTERLGYADDVESALAAFLGKPDALPARRSVYLYRSEFAARGEAVKCLEQALFDARENRAGWLLVTGESGGGKTRLLTEIATTAVHHDMVVVTGDCPPIGAGADGSGPVGSPLQPFRQFLVTVADECRVRTDLRSSLLPDERIRVLGLYEPSLYELAASDYSAPASPLSVDAARARLFASLAGLLVDYANHRPLLLALDDLQWADELSLEFLDWLSSFGEKSASYVVVGTCRVEEMGLRLGELAKKPAVRRVHLPEFDRAAIRQMIGGMLALSEPPESLVDFVQQESHGNPFFISEYLRAAIDAGLLRRDAAGRWRLAFAGEPGELRERVMPPPTIGALIALRLNGLERASREVLSATAVLGREFDVELVALTAGKTQASVLSAYAELRPRRILEADDSGISRFAHDKLREIAYSEITEETRIELHRRAALALEARYTGRALTAHVGELGYHFARAVIPNRASHYYELAGRTAQSAYANHDAVRFFRLALEQAESASDFSQADQSARLLEQIADVLLVIGQSADARAALERALQVDGHVAAAQQRARRHRKLAQTWEREHLHIQALAAYGVAEACLGDVPDAEASSTAAWWHEFVQIQVDKAWALYFLARVDELAILVERVRPAVAIHASPVQRTKFWQALVQATAKRDRFRISRETLEHSRVQLEAAHECGDSRELASAQFTRAFVLLLHGLDDDAEALFLAAMEEADRTGDALLLTRARAYHTILLRRLARVESAHASAQALLAYAEARTMTDYVGVAKATLSWCAWRHSDFEVAERLANEALAAWDQLLPSYVYPFQWIARMQLAACLHDSDRTEAAQRQLRLTLQDPQQILPDELRSHVEAAADNAGNMAEMLEQARLTRFL